MQWLENVHPGGFKVSLDQLKSICALLKENDQLFFDMLSNISAVDLGADAQLMEVNYHLYSIPNEASLTLRVEVDRKAPKVPTVSDLWRAADWHEREAFDLLGIHFEGHPDLRRILLPNDWEGYPLRKDYQEQEKYHGINVKYDRED